MELVASARRELRKLGSRDRQRILDFLDTRIATDEDPRRLAEAMAGPFKGRWRYRVGDFRIVANIEDKRVTVLVLRIANRREVYR